MKNHNVMWLSRNTLLLRSCTKNDACDKWMRRSDLSETSYILLSELTTMVVPFLETMDEMGAPLKLESRCIFRSEKS